VVAGRSREARTGLSFTDLDSAFLWASLLMLLSSFAAYLIMKRIGIIR
jgi:zinc transporter